MVKRDKKDESSSLQPDSKWYVEILRRSGHWPLIERSFENTTGVSPQPAKTGDDSYAMDEKEAARYVKEFVESHNRVLDGFIITVRPHPPLSQLV